MNHNETHSMKHTQKSIGRDAALALYGAQWWLERTDREIAEFQMLTEELCLPFSRFHEALEATLGRPVFTHELGVKAGVEQIMGELFDNKPAPSFGDILSIIPKDKLIIIIP